MIGVMIGVIDYGMGNLRSVQKALELLNEPARFVREPAAFGSCEKLILPGVGAFGDAMANLRERGFVDPLGQWIAADRPLLGICLGLQLLFQTSEEGGEHEGLGVLGGRVVRFSPSDPALKVPHMGWNAITPTDRANPLFAGLPDEPYVYFVHAYYACPDDSTAVAATCDYDGPFCCSIRRGNLYATQFHPEKSQRVGLRMLANFAALS